MFPHSTLKAASSSRIIGKLFSTNPKCYNFALALDIDGVFIRGGNAVITIPTLSSGGNALDGAKRSLRRLDKHGIPYVFLTNGGGYLEQDKTRKLADIIGMDIDPKRMIQSHTPMREIVDKYKDKNILILGSLEVKKVAKSYGFQKIITVEDFAQHTPSLYPMIKWEPKDFRYASEEIEAIFVMHDPIHWAPDLQITVDILMGGSPLGSGRPDMRQTPIYFSNSDFTYSGEYPVPRFAQGAFTDCLAMLYEKRSGSPLKATNYGKPHQVTYKFAENVLHSMLGKNQQIDRIYGIGDNPFSDIQGANNAGNHWISVLVRTGVFQDENASNHNVHPADIVSDSIEHALDDIFSREIVTE